MDGAKGLIGAYSAHHHEDHQHDDIDDNQLVQERATLEENRQNRAAKNILVDQPRNKLGNGDKISANIGNIGEDGFAVTEEEIFLPE